MAIHLFRNTLEELLGVDQSDLVFDLLEVHPSLMDAEETLNRAQISQLMNMVLFHNLLDYVPEALVYAKEQLEHGRKIHFDHGALRTVSTQMKVLPQGKEAFSRIFEPLGYQMAGEYPLDKLKMCGFVYTHRDYPEVIAQYFVSELYPERFSPDFQKEALNLVYESVDPLNENSVHLLDRLARGDHLVQDEATALIRNLAVCFDRQHAVPTLDQYQCFLNESAEMAWISTEGNAFNHATDRVQNLDELEHSEKSKGRPMKPEIEEGVNARIRQTAYRASVVERDFRTENGVVTKQVPGSFFEFIQRGELVDPETGKGRMDLRFDSRNAQGIFKMTR